MNGNDLMDALSGLDPKYIDEAAHELHSLPEHNARAGRSRLYKKVFTVLPIAAAVLLMAGVALPMLIRQGSSSTTMSDSAAEAPQMEAETGTYAPETGDTAYEAEALAEPAYEAEAPTESADKSDAASEAAGSAPGHGAAAEESSNQADFAAEKPVSQSDSASEKPASQADSAAEKPVSQSDSASEKPSNQADSAVEKPTNQADSAAESISAARASYDDGILRIDKDLNLGEDISEAEYAIIGTDEKGEIKTYAEGKLGDIMTRRNPLTFDLSDLELTYGEYMITIDDRHFMFEVNGNSSF